ncbi:MAG: hypothetical protein ABR557_06760 [Pyrinomonadaceae bacterium]
MVCPVILLDMGDTCHVVRRPGRVIASTVPYVPNASVLNIQRMK